ncbi:hypothetical protein ACGFYM_40320 [Streptomyces sp. NPDC048231]
MNDRYEKGTREPALPRLPARTSAHSAARNKSSAALRVRSVFG